MLRSGATSLGLTTTEAKDANEQSRERRLHAACDERGARYHHPQSVGVVQTAEPGVVPSQQSVEREYETCGDEEETDDQPDLGHRPIEEPTDPRVVRKQALRDAKPPRGQEEIDRLQA